MKNTPLNREITLMILPFNLRNQLDRWYPLDPIPIHMQLVEDTHRFLVVAAGRRSGKSERAKRKLVKAAMDMCGGMFFIAAPTYTQVKKIYWEDVKQLALSSMCERKPSESELIIYLDNGSQIHLISLDVPSRIEGIPWTGGIIDEFAYVKEDAWNLSISPALDTKDPRRPGHKAWCWLIGKPDGINHFYNLYQYAASGKDPEWAAYTWPSSLVLDEATIKAAKARMSPRQFRQEYEASFETVSSRIYESYCKDNYTNEYIQPHEQIHYFCDFNFTPMSHGIAVIRGNEHKGAKDNRSAQDIYVLDEVILTSARGYMNVMEFCEKYKNHMNKNICLYGDASGKAGEKHGLDSEYTLMMQEFEKNGWDVEKCVKPANPAIKARHNAVNAKICNAAGERSLFVNPLTAPWTSKGLHTTVFKEGSTFQEEQNSNECQHITTGLGYFIDYMFPIEYDIDPRHYRYNNLYGE